MVILKDLVGSEEDPTGCIMMGFHKNSGAAYDTVMKGGPYEKEGGSSGGCYEK